MLLKTSYREGTLSFGQKQIFYGWIIVAACLTIQWLASVLWMNSYGVYTIKLQEEFGWSMTVLAGAFAMIRLESGLLGPIQGWMTDRYGPRLVLLLGIGIFSGGLVMFSFINTMTGFFVSVALIAVGSSLGGWATLTVAVVNWFDKHRSKAIALTPTGLSASGLCVPLIAFGIDILTWRTMALVSAGVLLVIAVPLAFAVLAPPRPIGVVSNQDDEASGADIKVEGTSFTWRQAVATRSFWLISMATP